MSDDQRSLLKNTLKALEPFRDLRDAMPLQYVTTFMLVRRAAERLQKAKRYSK